MSRVAAGEVLATRELAPGDRVVVDERTGLVRTVDRIAPLGWLSNAGELLYGVYYLETDGRWGPGNSAHANTGWLIA